MNKGTGTRFDWYEATADGDHDFRLPDRLTVALAGAVARRGKGRNGYAECVELVRGEDVLAQVYGHSARAGEVHVTVTSESCDEVVPRLRSLLPEHRVSRADSSIDYAADFAELDSITVAFGEQRGLSSMLITNSDGGATRYLGSPSSEVRLRLYKKSEQLLAAHPDRADRIAPGIVRFELQVRPGKRDIKERVSTMHPDDVWGLAKWASEFAAEVIELEDLERVPTHFRKPSNYSRSLHYLGAQYGPLMRDRADAVGRELAIAELLATLGI